MGTKPIYVGIDLKKTGENITRMRENSGLSVKDIQEYMGLSEPQAVYKWQRGETIPSLEHLKILSLVCQVLIDDIIVWIIPPSAEVASGHCTSSSMTRDFSRDKL